MKKSWIECVLPWLRGIVAICTLFLSITFVVQGEWLKAVVCADRVG